MKQYEPCIQNNIIIKNKNKKINTKVKKEEGILFGERARQEDIFIFSFFFSSLLSQIYENWTIGFHRG